MPRNSATFVPPRFAPRAPGTRRAVWTDVKTTTLRRIVAAPHGTPVERRDTPLLPSRPLPAGTSRGTILVLTGPNAGRVAVVEPHGIVVGRGEEADLAVDDPAVSSRHARVAAGPDGGFHIEDLESTNGTFVAGRRVRLAPLSSGDAIQLGPGLKLRFTLSEETDESLQRRLYESSVRDRLTGVFNRAYFADRMMVEAALARRGQGAAVSLLMIDLDGLKRVNDRHGHLSGDRALSFVAARMASATRLGDVLARYGGDEFVVVAGRTDLAEALVLAERLRQVVAQVHFAAGGERVTVTVSIGVGCSSELQASGDADPLEALIALADERLYAAKRAGGNRVHSSRIP